MSERTIRPPDTCFGLGREVREGDPFDEAHYALWVIDNQSPDYEG